MEIFKTVNLLTELKDYLSAYSVKLGQLSYLGAGRERWFQFEVAQLIMEKWERIINKPWESWHLYAEVKADGEKSPIDLVVAPEKKEGIQWDNAGIIELKQVWFPVYEPGNIPKKRFTCIKRQIECYYEKRQHLNCEMITIALAHHHVNEEQEKNQIYAVCLNPIS